MDDSNPIRPDSTGNKEDSARDTVPATPGISSQRAKPVVSDSGSGIVIDETKDARIKAKEAKDPADPSQKDIYGPPGSQQHRTTVCLMSNWTNDANLSFCETGNDMK
jgi:hypothetical protein